MYSENKKQHSSLSEIKQGSSNRHRSRGLPVISFYVGLWFICTPGHASDQLLFKQIETFLNTADIPSMTGDSPSDEVSIIAAGDEYEPARVILKSTTDFGITTASISQLLNDDGLALPESTMEIRNVLRWTQLVPHAYKTNEGPRTHDVDELLVFDSTEPLKGKWENNRYLPPNPHSEFRSNMKAGTELQIWLTARIEMDQAAGIYRGAITLHGQREKAVLPLSVQVLPFNLPEPDKYFGIFYRGSLAANKRQVSIQALRAQLTDIKQHGFNALVINEFEPDHIDEFIDVIALARLNGPVILNFPDDVIQDANLMTRIDALLENANIEQRFIYGVDEPNTEQRMEQQAVLSRSMPPASKIFTSLRTDTDDILTSRDVRIDWVNFSIRSGLQELQKKANDASRTTSYYWQSYLEDAPRNRYYTGIFLMKSGLDGVFPYAYQAFHTIDPYLTDERELRGRKIRASRLYKVFNSTYPTTGRPIPTLQWEAAREGIDDYRYAQLLLQILDNSTGNDIGEVRRQLGDRVKNITYQESIPFQIDQNFDAAELTEIRSWIVENILKLTE